MKDEPVRRRRDGPELVQERGQSGHEAGAFFSSEALSSSIGPDGRIELLSVAMTVFDLDRPEGIRHTANRLRDLGFTVTENDYTAQADVDCLRDCYKALRHLRRTGYVAADQLEEAMR